MFPRPLHEQMEFCSSPKAKQGKGRTGGFWRRLLLAIALGIFHPCLTEAQSEVSKEYQIKAAFLYNFAQFVEWPAAAFANDDAPICIGVLGDNPFGPALEETVRGETVHHRGFIVEHSQHVKDLENCQLLFISRSEQGHLAEILSALNPKAVLTVSEVEGFANRGGVINFYLEGNKIRFEINPVNASSRGIRLSSQLLNLGRIVGQQSAGEGY